MAWVSTPWKGEGAAAPAAGDSTPASDGASTSQDGDSDTGTALGAFGRHVVTNIPAGEDAYAWVQSQYSGKPFAQQKQELQAQEARDWEEHPYATGAGVGASYIGQAAALPFTGVEEATAAGLTRLAPSAAKIAPLLAKTGVGAGIGAVAGGTEGEGAWDTQGALYGAGLGGLGGAAGAGLGALTAKATGPVAEAANRLDVPMPRYQMGNPLMQRMGTVSQSVPLVGEFTRSAAGKATDALADAVQSRGGVTPEAAGSQIRDAINDWVQNASTRKTERLYRNAESQIDQNMLHPLTNTNALLQQMQTQLQQRGASLSGASIDEIAKANRRIADINNRFFAANPNAPASAAPGGLSYNAIRDLRTTIGQMKSTWGRINPDPIDEARIARLRGALSQDLDAAAQRADRTGQGFAAHKNADRVYGIVQNNREALEPLVGAQGDKPPEQVFAGLLRRANENPTSADIDLLKRAKAAVQNSNNPGAWDAFQRATIGRLGVGKSGFTPDMYLNHYSGIDNDAKDVLFGQAGQGNRQALDDAAIVAQKMKDAGFAKNPSGTSHATMAGLLGGGLLEYGGHLMGHPFATAAGVGGIYGLKRFMLDPVTGTAGRNAGRLLRHAAPALTIGGGPLGGGWYRSQVEPGYGQ